MIPRAPNYRILSHGFESDAQDASSTIKLTLPRASAPAGLANALTVDVEDYFHVSALAPSIPRHEWELRKPRVVDNTRKLLDLFQRFDVHATFFVLGWVAERTPGLVREIAAQGHEIACHGLSHRLVYEQSPEEFRAETARAKRLIEDIAGCGVIGYRAASYSIVRESLWALDILAELGFAYDSSIFPVRHDRYGIPGAERVPHRMSTPGGASIVEWPLATAQVLGCRLPVAGGGYFRLLPYWLTRWGLASINRVESQPFIFYLHPWEIDPQQPRVAAGLLSRLRHYTNLDKCEARLRRLLGDFRFGTVRDALEKLRLLASAAPTQ